MNDFDEISSVEETKTSEQQNGINGITLPAEKLSSEMRNNHSDTKSQDTADEIRNLEDSFSEFPIKSLQALKYDHICIICE